MDIHKTLHDLRALAIRLDEHTQSIDVSADAELIVDRATEIIERLSAMRDRCGIAPRPEPPSELQRQHDVMHQQAIEHQQREAQRNPLMIRPDAATPCVVPPIAPKPVTFRLGGNS